ncbi:MAG: phosphatase PAP2 family protein, partial [Actinomycetes bacterium]
MRELVLILSLFVVYRIARLVITGHDDMAIANAWWVWDVERALRLPDEETLQDWALQWPELLRAANWYYVVVHFPITAAFLAWGWWRRPPAEYRWARRLITVLTGLALVVHVLMPLAPPRMLHSLGFLDTMAVFGPSAYDGSAANLANQFAAMPSLHVGWALLIAIVVIRTTSTPWRWVVAVHPLITVVVVVATANHYWIDAIAAALLLAVALAVTPGP